MKAINKQGKKIMDVLAEGVISEATDSKKIDNMKGVFMAVHVEFVSVCNLGQIFSVTHYYEQNGDLMRDPDMEFIKGSDGEYYPISFWQDEPLKRDEAVEWEDSEITRINPKMQAALTSFANTWMRNIREQQGLKI